ncbi:MAG: hypothetical protein H0X25_03450 [Acidobacteriales bacterium]|nr:hypothetical protein [Terriglobales bacterium]
MVVLGWKRVLTCVHDLMAARGTAVSTRPSTRRARWIDLVEFLRVPLMDELRVLVSGHGFASSPKLTSKDAGGRAGPPDLSFFQQSNTSIFKAAEATCEAGGWSDVSLRVEAW